MEGGSRDERDQHPPELRSLVVAEASRAGIWAAMERYGIPYGTVRLWQVQEEQGQTGEGDDPDAADADQIRTWRVHTPEEKAAALEDLETMDPESAAEKHGVTVQTIRAWRRVATEAAALSEESSDEEDDGATAADGTGVQVEAVDSETWEEISRPRGGQGRRYTPSQRADAVADASVIGVAAAARKAGVSRHTLYLWIRRTQQASGEAPPTRRWEQSEVEKQRDLEILHEWHKQPGLGPMQIRSQLRRRGVRTSVHTVRRVMEDNGYRPPKVESHAHNERYEAVRPNQLWHLDFVHRHIHIAGTFTLILLDDHSRYVTGFEVGDAERADTVLETFEAAVARHGRPEAVMSDRGAAFRSWRGVGRFTRLLEEMGVDQIVAEHKELNGKVEVFNANLAKELFDTKRFDDVGRMRAALAEHLHWYNHQRTHQSLGGLLVPADRYYGRVDEVMRSLESGQPAEADPHDPCLDARVLTLLQVVSRGGEPEIWLLGKRLL